MIRHSIFVMLAAVTLMNSISAGTIFDQTSQNVHVVVTDYKDQIDYPVLYSWRASDFYKNGMNPIRVTITNNDTKDIIISGKVLRSKNEVGIVGNPYMKPWSNKVITSGLQIGSLAPLIYATFQAVLRNDFGMLPLCWMWTLCLGTNYSQILTTAFILDYLPKNKLVRASAIVAASLISIVNLTWHQQKDLVTKIWAHDLFMVTDLITIQPGQLISKVAVVNAEYPVLQLPIIHTDVQSNTKITQMIPIHLIK